MLKFDAPAPITPADASNGRHVKVAEQTTAEYGDGVRRIEAPANSRILGSSGSIELTVQLPVGSPVEANSEQSAWIGVVPVEDTALAVADTSGPGRPVIYLNGPRMSADQHAEINIDWARSPPTCGPRPSVRPQL